MGIIEDHQKMLRNKEENIRDFLIMAIKRLGKRDVKKCLITYACMGKYKADEITRELIAMEDDGIISARFARHPTTGTRKRSMLITLEQ